MKNSIRSKRFTIGIGLFLVIILLLSVLSAFYLNRLSGKTSAILKENHYSVVFARDMSEDLTIINKEITNCFLTNNNPDTSIINKELRLFVKSLQSEQNNITEIGEDDLVSGIEKGFIEYSDSVVKFMKSPKSVVKVLYLQNKFNNIYQQLILLSQMNEKAIEEKTDDAKVSAKNTSIQMSFIGALCFLIAYGFTFSFASYFNERFYELYNGIKETVASHYTQRLDFKGEDEIYEISLIFNEMAEKLTDNNQEKALTLHSGPEKDYQVNDIQKLKEILIHMKSIEVQAIELISKLENKK
jgi:two-component system, NtrC family, sensor histidine kinase KinB